MIEDDMPGVGSFWRRHGAAMLFAFVLALGFALYVYKVKSNPAGFHIDESSIGYNAYTISQTGRDEFGNSWPLFFRAFGEYKNPVYIYLLAALFRLTDPSILVARLLSVAAGVVAAALVGLLGARVSGRRGVGLMIAASALLTPWLFELSRVVIEVALFPLTTALFLLCAHRASRRARWSWLDALSLALSLALLTYAYSIGRLLAPLLAFGLLFFASRERLRGLLTAWGIYALTFVPMIGFHWRHPDALLGRFKAVSYITPTATTTGIVRQFVKHYIANFNPRALFVTGDPGEYQMAQVTGQPLLLLVTAAFALIGLWLALRRERDQAWWRFVVYGLAVSVVPASLTVDDMHMLRLSAVPVFLILMTVPAFTWLTEKGGRARRVLLVVSVILTLAQGLAFQWRYHTSAGSPWRLHVFDAGYPTKILPTALAAARSGPVYLDDAPAIPGHIQAFWYATLQKIPHDKFFLLATDAPPPEGAVVITTREKCSHCQILAESEPYIVYLGESPSRAQTPLPGNGPDDKQQSGSR